MLKHLINLIRLCRFYYQTKKNHDKTVLVASSKLNSIINIISKVLKHNGISHENFKTITNEERN